MLSRMSDTVVKYFLACLLLFGGFVGCAPQLGDPCLSNLECPESATCDTTALGGYCLMYDCQRNGCPEGSVCVFFDTFTVCMDHCTADEDCRVEDGHVCRADLPPTPFCYHAETSP